MVSQPEQIPENPQFMIDVAPSERWDLNLVDDAGEQ